MKQRRYIIEGMDCADCAQTIEKGVRQLPGVEKVELNYTTTELVVEGDVNPEDIDRRVTALGYQLKEAEDTRRLKKREPFFTGFIHYMLSDWESRLAAIGGILIAVAFLLNRLGIHPTIVSAVQIAALALAGFPVARSAITNLIINRDLNMNFLMTTAAIGAVIIGEIPEAASLIFLFAVAEALEGYTADRARRSIGELAELAPAMALKLDGGSEKLTPVEELNIGDRILVMAGERIAMDGVVYRGQSEVNQAPITGESLPVAKAAGDEVFAGTVNGGGVLHVTVTRPVRDNTLNRIIHLVEQAQAKRAPAQRFIDRFARWYTPAMMVVALLVATVPSLMFGGPLLNQPDGTRGWLYRGLAMLVIGCPCALVISTPVTIISAVAAAARRGVLFKGGAYLEALQEVKVIAFDKTGTLTQGVPRVSTARSVDCETGLRCLECDDVLALAAALERRSSHPLAQAVIAAAEEHGIAQRYPAAESVTILPGLGIEGRVNGQTATIGNHTLFDIDHPHADKLCGWVESAEALGQTTMLVYDGTRVRGYLAVSDTLRNESAQVVAELKQTGKQVAMLTGDNPGAAQSVAHALGIDHVQAGLLPEEKVTAVRKLQADIGNAAMVGDGINDAPALAAASVGIAMGGAGSAQAMETADIVLMAEELTQLPFAIRLSKLVHKLILENVSFSLGIKAVFLALALGGWTPMWLAVLADMGVSLLVTFNSMRPLAVTSH